MPQPLLLSGRELTLARLRVARDEVPAEIVGLTLLLKVNSLLVGLSGVTECVVDTRIG